MYTIADMVNAEHRLLTDVLHLNGLHAVVGISMGGMQVFEWSVRYPDFAKRFVAIVGTPKLSPYDELLWRTELGILDRALAVSCDEGTKRQVMASVGAVHELALSTPAHVNATVARASFDAWLAEREAFYVSGGIRSTGRPSCRPCCTTTCHPATAVIWRPRPGASRDECWPCSRFRITWSIHRRHGSSLVSQEGRLWICPAIAVTSPTVAKLARWRTRSASFLPNREL